MPKAKKPDVGAISWTDLTVKNAKAVRDFYAAVVGWKVSEVEMDGYSDFGMMRPGDKKMVAGICHARGENKNLPAQWLIYITVADLDASLQRCVKRGGKIVVKARALAGGRIAVIRDPAGAVAALYEAGQV